MLKIVLLMIIVVSSVDSDYLNLDAIDSSELSDANLRRAVSALNDAQKQPSSGEFSMELELSAGEGGGEAAPATPTSKERPSGKCEPIAVPMCRQLEYNMTSMPNQFEHTSQSEATAEAHQFWALVEFKCSPELKFFLCSMYTPICIPGKFAHHHHRSSSENPNPSCFSK